MMRHLTILLVACSLTLALSGCQTSRPTDAIRDHGDFLFDHGQYAEAADEYTEIVHRYPGDWQAQHRLGVCLMHTNQLPQARSALETAYSARRNDSQVASDLAEVMYRQGDTNRLFALLRERAEATHSTRAYEQLADYAMQAGDPDSAKSALETAIEVDNGKSVDPYLAAADFEQKLGNLDQATRRLRQAYGINPKDPRVNDRLRQMGEVPGPTLALPPGR
ncbi:MAG TPA: tetratricopeptide repeat protein [Phycisphaerales bacterium]|nr:tetratricopeptide repeat protein [Phycisphaerales bacterium]